MRSSVLFKSFCPEKPIVRVNKSMGLSGRVKEMYSPEGDGNNFNIFFRFRNIRVKEMYSPEGDGNGRIL